MQWGLGDVSRWMDGKLEQGGRKWRMSRRRSELFMFYLFKCTVGQAAVDWFYRCLQVQLTGWQMFLRARLRRNRAGAHAKIVSYPPVILGSAAAAAVGFLFKWGTIRHLKGWRTRQDDPARLLPVSHHQRVPEMPDPPRTHTHIHTPSPPCFEACCCLMQAEESRIDAHEQIIKSRGLKRKKKRKLFTTNPSKTLDENPAGSSSAQREWRRTSWHLYLHKSGSQSCGFESWAQPPVQSNIKLWLLKWNDAVKSECGQSTRGSAESRFILLQLPPPPLFF